MLHPKDLFFFLLIAGIAICGTPVTGVVMMILGAMACGLSYPVVGALLILVGYMQAVGAWIISRNA